MEVDVVDFAYRIIDLHRENLRLAAEVERLKGIGKDYREMGDSRRRHNMVMIGHVLEAALGEAPWVPKQQQREEV
jgi:hypothetical protein